MYMMRKEAQSDAGTTEYKIAREREFEKIKQHLYKEFKQLDVNNDD